MNQLVIMENGESRTTSILIAEGLEVEHRAIIQLIRKHQPDLEEFGRVAFEMRAFGTGGGVQAREIADLNERQATLILTYAKNTEIARTFKKRLVKAFYELAQSATVPAIADPQTRALIQLLTEQDALKQEQSRQGVMIEDVNSRVDALTPRMTASSITRLLGRISHVAKIYRNAQATKHIKLNVGESTGYFHSMILDKFDVADINYLDNVNKAIRMLEGEEKKHQKVIDDHEENTGLFRKGEQ